MTHAMLTSVELLVYFLTDFISFNKEYKQRVLCTAPGLYPYWFHTLLIRNISRTPLRSPWSVSLLIPYTLKKEYKEKCSVELLVYFLTDMFLFTYRFHTRLMRNISRSPLWSSWSISLLISWRMIRNTSRSPLLSSWFISLLISYICKKGI